MSEVTKQWLFDAMKSRISVTSIGEYSGEMQIICKFGLVSWMGDYWDIWVTGVHHGKELSQKKANNLSAAILDRVKCDFQELNRESVAHVPDDEGAYLCAVLMGARRKRKVSVSQLAALRKNQFKSTKTEA